MLRRKLLVGALSLGLLVTMPGVAQAWDLIHDKSGFDRVVLRAWTRNYNQIAYVAEHAGTRISVQVKVECGSGATFSDTWSDGGERFRFILRGLGDEGRCNHTFTVDARKDDVQLDLALFARG
jgi:hypothetical protein